MADHRAKYIQMSTFHVANTHTSIRTPATKYRCTKKLDQAKLLRDLSMVPWHILIDANTVDYALHTFESLVSNVWDTHAPRKRKQQRRKLTPWMTPTVLGQMQSHNRLYFSFCAIGQTKTGWPTNNQEFTLIS